MAQSLDTFRNRPLTEADLPALEAALANDPRVQEWQRTLSRRDLSFKVNALLHTMGIQPPDGYRYTQASRFRKGNSALPYIVTGLGLPLGLHLLGAPFGASGPAASGAAAPLASQAIPGIGPAATPSAAVPTVASTAPAAAGPLADALGGDTPSTPPVGAGSPGGVGDTLRDFFTDPQNIAGLATLITSLATSPGGYDTEELRRIQGITEAQMRRADPLHQVATNLAFGRMPTNYRQGVSLSPVPLPE